MLWIFHTLDSAAFVKLIPSNCEIYVCMTLKKKKIIFNLFYVSLCQSRRKLIIVWCFHFRISLYLLLYPFYSLMLEFSGIPSGTLFKKMYCLCVCYVFFLFFKLVIVIQSKLNCFSLLFLLFLPSKYIWAIFLSVIRICLQINCVVNEFFWPFSIHLWIFMILCV